MNGSQESQKLESALNVNQPIGIKNENEIPYGYCHCGCGQKTTISKKTITVKKHKYTKGTYTKFLNGHSNKLTLTNKGMRKRRDGRNSTYCFNHPRADERNKVLNYILVVERALGKYISTNAVVHHIDRNPGNDNNDNLVLCEDRAYHNFLHQRMRAYEACGHANWIKCRYCKQYSDPDNSDIYLSGKTSYHKKCGKLYYQNRYFEKHK